MEAKTAVLGNEREVPPSADIPSGARLPPVVAGRGGFYPETRGPLLGSHEPCGSFLVSTPPWNGGQPHPAGEGATPSPHEGPAPGTRRGRQSGSGKEC